MDLLEYESSGQEKYDRLAKAICRRLQNAIDALPYRNGLQKIESRAKQVSSLRNRLEEQDALGSAEIENLRRDLAGVRLIFYTNNDLDRFLATGIIEKNFDVEADSYRRHHPGRNLANRRYRGAHCTVRLRKDSHETPGFEGLENLRCEIQVQTILDHAWSEIEHDIIYKSSTPPGFGTTATNALARRFESVMDKYLVPAGYEIQLAQRDFENLQIGGAIYSGDLAKELVGPTDNNTRFALLLRVRDLVVPNCDRPSELLRDCAGPLVASVAASLDQSDTPTQSLAEPSPGISGDAVAQVAIEILESLRFAGVGQVLGAFLDILSLPISSRIRASVASSSRRLATPNIAVLQRVGLREQREVLSFIEALPATEQAAAWSLTSSLLTGVLNLEMTATESTADAIKVRSGIIPYSAALHSIHSRAVSCLAWHFAHSPSETRIREALGILNSSVHRPSTGEISAEHEQMLAANAKTLVDAAAGMISESSLALRQHIEHVLFHLHRHFATESEDAAPEPQGDDCRPALIEAIIAFRDRVNADATFRDYKALVGFESIFPPHWEPEPFDLAAAREYRQSRVSAILEIANQKQNAGMLELIQRCTETESEDGATFPTFVRFLDALARQDARFAAQVLEQSSSDLIPFAHFLLNGIEASGDLAAYEEAVDCCLNKRLATTCVLRHLQHSAHPSLGLALRAAQLSIDKRDAAAAAEAVAVFIARYIDLGITETNAITLALFKSLADLECWQWIQNVWFLNELQPYFQNCSRTTASLALRSLQATPTIDHRLLSVVAAISLRDAAVAWEFLADRLRRPDPAPGESPSTVRLPHGLGDLATPLSTDPREALSRFRSLFESDRAEFELTGARLLGMVFAGPNQRLLAELRRVLDEGEEDGARFVLSILRQFDEPEEFLDLLMSIVARHAAVPRIMTECRCLLFSVPATWGEYGIADRWTSRVDSLGPWQEHEDANVRSFATELTTDLKARARDEERRVEVSRELRRRSFGVPDAPGSSTQDQHE